MTSKHKGSQCLMRAEYVLAKVRHVELHPIVAAMVKGLNKINKHNFPRAMALTNPSTVSIQRFLPRRLQGPRNQGHDFKRLRLHACLVCMC